MPRHDGPRIPSILESTACDKHNAPTGIPCYHVNFVSKPGYGAGVCGKRTRAAGFTETLDPSSMFKSKK